MISIARTQHDDDLDNTLLSGLSPNLLGVLILLDEVVCPSAEYCPVPVLLPPFPPD